MLCFIGSGAGLSEHDYWEDGSKASAEFIKGRNLLKFVLLQILQLKKKTVFSYLHFFPEAH